MAAGKGTRMLPLTENTPKVLIDIDGKPFLYYVIQNLKKAGFEGIAIIAGYKKEKINEFLDKYAIKAEVIIQDEQLGTGHAVKLARDFAGNENFVVLGGDNLFSVADLEQLKKPDYYNYVIGMRHKNPEHYGVLLTDGVFLKKIVEKPQRFVGDLINIGLYKFTPEIFKALDQIKLSERGEYELTDAITLLAEKGQVKVLKLKDYWLDFGCKDDIPHVERFIKLQKKQGKF